MNQAAEMELADDITKLEIRNQITEAIEDYENINETIGKLYSYVSLSFSINTDKPEYGQKYQEIRAYRKCIFFSKCCCEKERKKLS